MGDVFAGRYELVDPLGEGGAGVVWRAWDRKRQHYTAAKVLRQVDAASLLRFMREQSMRLDHPHVLAPTGWAGEDDKVLFTMPMMRGGSVSTLINDFGPLPPQLAAVLLDQLLAALEAIHAEGIVHRDVKPANLMLDATGRGTPRLWLGDFGIAAGDDAPRLTQGPFAMGTPGYVAPECLHHGWQPEARADLFAAGMCAMEMLTGVAPEADTHVLQAFSASGRAEDVPTELIRVIARLGNAVITERYASAAQARGALEATGLLEHSSPEELLGEVEVFNHIPELPDGWGEHGPLGAVAAAQPAPSEVPAGGPSPHTPDPASSQAPPADPPTELLDVSGPGAMAEPTQRQDLPPQRQMPVPQLGMRDRNTEPGNVFHAPPEHAAPVGTAAAAPQRPGFPVQPRMDAASDTDASGEEKSRAAQSTTRANRGQALAIALILFGLGLVVMAAALFLALS
ncbi:serine/threonine-protein kinase [Nesterenkonia muleiensis]|uniref:serine/threonine-protein kinase n=1 Tax=Nesterenkonia muleiensis TaxID=2282648 RepID=UPI000E70ECC2|nr:serine/threonine-protein kinase [Nesterenkonia muleiensis]